MELKVKIKTVEGKANDTLKGLTPIIGLGKGKTKIEGWVNKKDDILYLEIKGDSRHVKRIEKNVQQFSKTKKDITHTKTGKFLIKRLGGTEEQIVQLQELFDNDTEVTIVTNETAQELIDETMTLWQKIKKTFRRVKK
jgi:hypothetical protein